MRYKWGSRFNDNNLKTVQKVDYLSSLASLLQVSPCLHLSVRWSMGGADSRSSTTPLITERWTHLSSPSLWHQALLGAVIYQQNVNHNALSDEKLKGRNGASQKYLSYCKFHKDCHKEPYTSENQGSDQDSLNTPILYSLHKYKDNGDHWTHNKIDFFFLERLGPFCVEFACSPCASVGFLSILPSTQLSGVCSPPPPQHQLTNCTTSFSGFIPT